MTPHPTNDAKEGRHFRQASLAGISQWLNVDCSACKRPISGCHTDSTCAVKGAMCGIRAIEELAAGRPPISPAGVGGVVTVTDALTRATPMIAALFPDNPVMACRVQDVVRASLQAALGAGWSGWVKCSERMPEIDVPVLVQGGMALWRGGHWDSMLSHRAIEWDVAYWMPMPAPPPSDHAEKKGSEL